MNFYPTEISDVILVEPKVFKDERGFFLEAYQAKEFESAGIGFAFVQDNHSGSTQNILRGLHYQIQQPQGKLVRAIAGEIFDVAVDLRKNSPTFGKWVSRILTSENNHQLWIPPGFAHGFYVISKWAEVYYKATDFYAPQFDRSMLWSDPEVGIEWPIPIGVQPILSTKDQTGKSFTEAEKFDF